MNAILQTRDLQEQVALANVYWGDEFSGWRPVDTSASRTVTGGLVIQSRPLSAGRPITFRDFWLPRAALKVLYDFVSRPSAEFKLTLPDGRVFFVSFIEQNPLKADPVAGDVYVGDDDDDLYHVSSLLMTVIE